MFQKYELHYGELVDDQKRVLGGTAFTASEPREIQFAVDAYCRENIHHEGTRSTILASLCESRLNHSKDDQVRNPVFAQEYRPRREQRNGLNVKVQNYVELYYIGDSDIPLPDTPTS